MSSMVELYKQLLGFLETLRKSHRIFIGNGRLMASVAALTALFNSLVLLLTDFFSLRPLIADLLIKQHLILATGLILAYPAATVTILASALNQSGQGKLTRHREVAAAAAQCWKRPIATYLYVYFALGCAFLLPAHLFPLMPSHVPAVIITCGIFAALIYAYLVVLWPLGVVVSVLEEISGIESLRKAGRLVKGMELKGFCLSLMVNLVSYGAIEIWRLAIGNKGSYYEQSVFGLVAAGSGGAPYRQFVMGVALESGLWLVRMYGLVAFTVLYCEGKKNLGEETEVMVLGLGLHYTKVPSLPIASNTLP